MSYGPFVTTISITPQPGTQATTASSYSGSLNISPTSISQYGSVPNYGGTVTLTPNVTSTTTPWGGGWTATIHGPIQVLPAPQTEDEVILYLVGQILQGSGPSSGRTEENRRRMAENAVLDARAVLAAIRKIKQVTDVLQKRNTQGEEADAQQRS